MTSSSSDRARRRAVRAQKSETGESYTTAARSLGATGQGTATIDPPLLTPYSDETGVSAEELGWRVLPADATPQQRARAEAIWRPVTVERRCRCSGPCLHGERCSNGDDGIMSCTGFLQHYDRYPGSMLELTVWTDDYVCLTCGDEFDTTRTLPELPWGENQAGQAPGGTVLVVYPGVRHPNFAEDVDEHGPSYQPDYCPDCGFDTCACDRDSGCQECGAGSPGDPYGECVCEPE